MINKNDAYSQILEFLYKRSDERFQFDRLYIFFDQVDKLYLLSQIKFLVADEMITKQNIEYFDETDRVKIISDYRIGYKGRLYINELRKTQNSFIIGVVAISISTVALIITIISKIHCR